MITDKGIFVMKGATDMDKERMAELEKIESHVVLRTAGLPR